MLQVVIEHLHVHDASPRRRASFPLVLGDQTHFLIEGEVVHMALKLPVGRKVPYTLPKEGKDSYGNKVALATLPEASVSDPEALLLLPDPSRPDDPAAGILQAGTTAKTGLQFVVTDADESPTPVTAMVEVEVVAGDLVSLSTDEVFGEMLPPDDVDPQAAPRSRKK